MRDTQSKAKATSVARAFNGKLVGTDKVSGRGQVTVKLRGNLDVKVKFSKERGGERFGVEVSQSVGTGSMKARQHFSIVHAVTPSGQPIWTVPGIAIRVEDPEKGWLAIAKHLAETSLSSDTSPEELFRVGDRVSFTFHSKLEIGELVDIYLETQTAVVWVDKKYLRHEKDAGLREVSLKELHNV